MPVRLRLRRTGTKNKASFRVVACDKRCPRDGKFIEILGFYDPRREQERVDLERCEYWLSVGAQPSRTVEDIITRAREGRPLTPPEKTKPAAAAPTTEEAKPEEAAAEAEKKGDDEAPAKEEEAAAAEPKAEETAKDEAPAEEKKEEKKAE